MQPYDITVCSSTHETAQKNGKPFFYENFLELNFATKLLKLLYPNAQCNREKKVRIDEEASQDFKSRVKTLNNIRERGPPV
jgi:hypothetical protein